MRGEGASKGSGISIFSKKDGFVRSPSAALRFTFVVAAYLASVVSLTFLYNTPFALSLSKGELYRGVPFMVRHANHERIVKRLLRYYTVIVRVIHKTLTLSDHHRL